MVIHATTVDTNSQLVRKGGLFALITTAGFEDILIYRTPDLAQALPDPPNALLFLFNFPIIY
jgi:N-methylhydantoinase A/oxoprolinase/acetone carboxylase beta subunit